MRIEVTPSGDVVCGWFALCVNTTTKAAPHPVLEYVPCCDRCAMRMGIEDRVELDLVIL